MIVAVADTHATVWYFFNDPRLSASARNAIEAAINVGHEFAISSITLIEMVYLTEKGRIPANALKNLLRDMAYPMFQFREVPVNARIAEELIQVPRADIPDMPDRIISATGIFLQAPVISRDAKIQASGIRTIW